MYGRFRKHAVCLLLAVLLVAGLTVTAFAQEGTPDSTAPVLTGMTLSATTVSAPDTIEVIVTGTDDISGLKSGQVWFVCKQTDKYVWADVHSTYRDGETGEYVPYPDGNLHGTIEIAPNAEAAVFDLSHIYLNDNAGNRAYYSAESKYAERFPETITDLQYEVVPGDTPDGTPPVLSDIRLSTPDVFPPADIDVIVSATDDISGVEKGTIVYICKETGKELYCTVRSTYLDGETGEYVPYPHLELYGKIQFNEFSESGTYELAYARLYDYAGNEAYYSADSQYALPFPDSVQGREIYVYNKEASDGTPPVLTDVRLSATTMTAPGTVDMSIYVTDDISGVRYIQYSFRCKETGKYLDGMAYAVPAEDETGADGVLRAEIEISQYLEAGTFELLYMNIYDHAGNKAYYHLESQYALPFPDSLTDRTIRVLNATPDVTTFVDDPDFADKIRDAQEDAYIVADYSGEVTLPETVFDALCGTDRILDLVSEGVTWRFDGNDIINALKSIGPNVDVTKVEENDSEAAQKILKKLKEAPAVLMEFAENGELPGKASIQLKVDDAMMEYLGDDGELCVYYYNNQTGQLELIAEDLVVINDTYVEFAITHCSCYVLTAQVVDNDADADLLLGDADGDGSITNVDAMLILQYYVGLIDGNALVVDACDVDGDGAVTNVDAMMVLQYYVGLIGSFETAV